MSDCVTPQNWNKRGVVRALPGDADQKQLAIGFVNEAVDDEATRGLIVVRVYADGSQAIHGFGETKQSDAAFAAAFLLRWAGATE